jgi:glycosyltransferase involved in cell wall biosynthesis
MKILQINNSHYKSGGAETVFFNIIELLKHKGHKVITLSMMNSKNVEVGDDDYFVNGHNFLHNKFYSFEARKKLLKLIAIEKPDIAHFHNIIGGITFSILPVLKQMGIPVIATVHDFRILCPAFIFINGNNEICERCKSGKFYNSVIYNCSPEGQYRSLLIAAESYSRKYLVPYNRFIDSIIFVSNFVQEKFFEVQKDIDKKSFQLYNFVNKIDPDETFGDYFLYFGRLAREKSLFTLLESFKMLPNLKLKIVGEGSLKEVLEQRKPSNVELIGYKTGDELINFIKKASFVIASSECYETNSMTTVEAYSMGKPVIGSNIGAISELIDNGSTGFLYEPKNSVQLSKLLNKCSMISKEDYNIMSKNVQVVVKNKFSSEVYYDQLINVYNRVLESAKK